MSDEIKIIIAAFMVANVLDFGSSAIFPQLPITYMIATCAIISLGGSWLDWGTLTVFLFIGSLGYALTHLLT